MLERPTMAEAICSRIRVVLEARTAAALAAIQDARSAAHAGPPDHGFEDRAAPELMNGIRPARTVSTAFRSCRRFRP